MLLLHLIIINIILIRVSFENILVIKYYTCILYSIDKHWCKTWNCCFYCINFLQVMDLGQSESAHWRLTGLCQLSCMTTRSLTKHPPAVYIYYLVPDQVYSGNWDDLALMCGVSSFQRVWPHLFFIYSMGQFKDPELALAKVSVS